MKKKVFVIALAVCLAVLSIAGSSIAYFTDTEQYTNVFTAGNVDISLTAAGNTVNESPLALTDENIYPGLTIEKDLTISNEGTEDAYVAAVITLTDNNGDFLTVVNADGSSNNIPVAIAKFLTGLGADGYKMNVVTESNKLTVYLIKTDKLVAKTDTATDTSVVFEDIVIPTAWDNAEINAFKDVKISVTAYATQTKGAGFENAESGIKTAFPEVFNGINFG